MTEIVPEFVDSASDGPVPGREDEWSVVTGYRIGLARQSRMLSEAERLQRMRTEWNRQRATAVLTVPAETLDEEERNRIRTLAVSLNELGQIQRELGQPECVASFQESLSLRGQIADRPGAAVCAFQLGNAYVELSVLRDLDQAEQWYRRSLDLRDERDSQGRARCIGQLGRIAYERFKEARIARQPVAELLRYLEVAFESYSQVLDLLPANAVEDRLVTHMQLGNTYAEAGDADNARSHWREAIRYSESSGDAYGAGLIRYNIARLFVEEGRFSEAREYALAALRNLEPFGGGASNDIRDTQKLLSDIERMQSRP